MSDESLRRLETVLIIIGEEWVHLREVARLAGHAHWKISTKTRKQQHTLVYARALNPRFVQCYIEESQMGTSLLVWRKSMAGVYEGGVQEMVLLKRTLGLLLRFDF